MSSSNRKQHFEHTLFLLLRLLLGSSATCGSSAASSRSSTTCSTRWDGGQLACTLSDQLCSLLESTPYRLVREFPYLLEILALELRDESGETLIISLDTDGFEDLF